MMFLWHPLVTVRLPKNSSTGIRITNPLKIDIASVGSKNPYLLYSWSRFLYIKLRVFTSSLATSTCSLPIRIDSKPKTLGPRNKDSVEVVIGAAFLFLGKPIRSMGRNDIFLTWMVDVYGKLVGKIYTWILWGKVHTFWKPTWNIETWKKDLSFQGVIVGGTLPCT